MHQGLYFNWEAGLFIATKVMQIIAWWPFLSVTVAFKQLLADVCFQHRAYMAMEETGSKEQVWAKNQVISLNVFQHTAPWTLPLDAGHSYLYLTQPAQVPAVTFLLRALGLFSAIARPVKGVDTGYRRRSGWERLCKAAGRNAPVITML